MANDCSLYPTRIDARMYFFKRNVSGDPVVGYVHQIPGRETFQLEWNKPTENSLDPIPSEEWFPLLGELTDVQVTINVELLGSIRLDFSANALPATWPISDTGLYYAVNFPYPVAWLDLDLELNIPQGIGWVDFEAPTSDPATPPAQETASGNVLSDRVVSLSGFLPRGVRADGTPVGEFEPVQYYDRFVTPPDRSAQLSRPGHRRRQSGDLRERQPVGLVHARPLVEDLRFSRSHARDRHYF